MTHKNVTNSLTLQPTRSWPPHGIIYLLPGHKDFEDALYWLKVQGSQSREIQQGNFLIEPTILGSNGGDLKPSTAYIHKNGDTYRLIGGLPNRRKIAELFVNNERVEAEGKLLNDGDIIDWKGGITQLRITFAIPSSLKRRQRKTLKEAPVLIEERQWRPEANPDNESMILSVQIERIHQTILAVAQLDVPRYFIGNHKQDDSMSGSAWMIAPSLAITCTHVLEARTEYERLDGEDFRDQVANSLLTFDYLIPTRGKQYRISLEYNNKELDYALIRLYERVQEPSRQWGYLKLGLDDAPLTTQTSLIVIQHPRGKPNQYAKGHYVRHSNEPGIIYHQAATDRGTSGSPIINFQNLEVLALHQGEDKKVNLRRGRLLGSILADLKANNAELYKEILDAQDRRE